MNRAAALSVRARVCTLIVRDYRTPKKGLPTKKSLHKRFRLKPNGKLKVSATCIGGMKEALLTITLSVLAVATLGEESHFDAAGELQARGAALASRSRFEGGGGEERKRKRKRNSSCFQTGSKSKWGQEKPAKPDLVDVLIAAQKRFKKVKGRDLTKEELPQVVAAIKAARIVGNRVYPGSTGVLKFQ